MNKSFFEQQNYGMFFRNHESTRMDTNWVAFGELPAGSGKIHTNGSPSATSNASGIRPTIPRSSVTLSAVEASL